jgi:hypothetical protein
MVAPIYYPPPPRPPLVSPETSLFIRKFLLALLIVSTLAALLVVVMQATLGIVGRSDSAEKVATAKRYADRANSDLQQGKRDAAEYDMDQAIENDPHNPQLSTSQAESYLTEAAQATDLEKRAVLYLQSAKQFKLACDDETDLNVKAKHSQDYANAALSAADSSIQVADSDLTRNVRLELMNAKVYVQNNPDLVSKIDEMIPRLTA